MAKVRYLKNQLTGLIWEVSNPDHAAYALGLKRDEEEHENEDLFVEVSQAEMNKAHGGVVEEPRQETRSQPRRARSE